MNIFTIGSLNLDYVYTVDHFVRPGETLSALKREIFPGGKGLNQSIALARAGVPVYHGGCIGHDGGLLLQTLKEAGADISLVEIMEEPTGHTVIQVDASGENCILLYGGANHSLTPPLLERMFARCEKGDFYRAESFPLGGFPSRAPAGKRPVVPFEPSGGGGLHRGTGTQPHCRRFAEPLSSGGSGADPWRQRGSL